MTLPRESYFTEIEREAPPMESKMIDTYEDEEGHGPKRTMAFRLQALEDQVELLREAVDQASEDVRRIKGVIG